MNGRSTTEPPFLDGNERITLRTQTVNGREYHVITRYVATSPDDIARRQEEVVRVVAQNILRGRQCR
jgi:hypothetical protein